MKVRIIIEGKDRIVDLDTYVKAKHKELLDSGYSNLTEEETRSQALKLLNGESLSIIGMFMEEELIERAEE